MVDINNTSFAGNSSDRKNLDWLSIASQWMALRSFFQGLGNTGILSVRQYSGGGDTAVDNRYTVGYRPLSVHDHSNYRYKCGMAERQGMANGFIYKSRHTDYNMRRPKAGTYLSSELITLPTVPASVVGTVAQQITEMQNYFQAMVDKNFSVYDYRPHFQWALSNEEVWPEAFVETITDTFDSDRHTVDASSVQEQVWKHWRDEYGGIMDRSENINVWPIVPMITSEAGDPELVTIKNRVTSQVVGDFGEFHPDDVFSPREDVYSERRAGATPPPVESAQLRHRVLYSTSTKALRSTPGILDAMMTRCYGLEGYGANLVETYYDAGDGESYNVANHGTTDTLNAATFTRFIGMPKPNASGRTDRRRGFRDPNLFCALTTHANVVGVSDGVRDHKYSWGIPLELEMLNPLMSWNPHNIPEKSDPTEGGTLDGATAGTAYSGYHESRYYYLTPDEFYNGDDPIDPADTSSAKWMLDGGGTPRLCRSSGPWVVLPPIANVTARVRGRYMIYEDAIQSPAMAQALALRP